MSFLNLIKIDEDSRKPKYKQIVDEIIRHIAIGNLNVDDKMPSINAFSEEFYLSRGTIEKAYRILKERKIITSAKGKGCYITRTKLISKVNILFLINKLSAYKMKVYNTFIDKLGANSYTNLHIYYCDEVLFSNLIEKNLNAYDYFVIIPHFKNKKFKHISITKLAEDSINKIPKEKLLILDNKLDMDTAVIYQDFENDIYTALTEGFYKISNYKKLFLAYPSKSIFPYPKRILTGFKRFCGEKNLDFEIIEEIYDDMILKKGDLFIVIEESDLVSIVDQVKKSKLESKIGIISYHDTPLKKLLGIACLSTDYKAMGESAADIILNHKKGKIKNPFYFIDRGSI